MALPGLGAMDGVTLAALLCGEPTATGAPPALGTSPRAAIRQSHVPDKYAKRIDSEPEAGEPGDANRVTSDKEWQPQGASSSDPLPRPGVSLATPPDDEDSAVMRVQVAGLVLAHPFLSSLFAARGLLGEDGKTLPSHQLPRAAALLHWLACGRDEVFEFELGLIKPLLGLRLSDPLPLSEGLLGDADREECTALLTAMISHWPALRSTSIEGLQLSFLQRQGLLRENEDGQQSGWQLQLESESFNMLLAQLPWSISIVRLPWMTRPIFTDWPTR
jgi:hypothetical protein